MTVSTRFHFTAAGLHYEKARITRYWSRPRRNCYRPFNTKALRWLSFDCPTIIVRPISSRLMGVSGDRWLLPCTRASISRKQWRNVIRVLHHIPYHRTTRWALFAATFILENWAIYSPFCGPRVKPEGYFHPAKSKPSLLLLDGFSLPGCGTISSGRVIRCLGFGKPF